MSPVKKPPFLLVPGGRLTGWEKVGLVVAAIFLLQYWLVVFLNVRSGNPFAHQNYWGQNVGTLLLAAICFFGTLTALILVWRHMILNLLVHKKKHERKAAP